MTALQLLVNTATLGAAYALVAVGFVLVLNASAAVNFAHGDLVMAGGMLGAVLAPHLPVGGALLLPLVALLIGGLGLAVGAVAWLPLRTRPPVAVFISTIAIGILIQNATLLLAGPEPRATPPVLAGDTFMVGGLTVADQSLAIVAVAVLLIGGLFLLLARTQTGRRLRAAAQDPEMARACGVPVTGLALASFALGSACAGVAGFLLANPYFVTPGAGGDLILKAYVAVTVGGWGSLPGAALGALLIAGFEVLVSSFVSYPAALAGLYLTLLVVLVLRPRGLLGEAVRRRA